MTAGESLIDRSRAVTVSHTHVAHASRDRGHRKSANGFVFGPPECLGVPAVGGREMLGERRRRDSLPVAGNNGRLMTAPHAMRPRTWSHRVDFDEGHGTVVLSLCQSRFSREIVESSSPGSGTCANHFAK